MKRFIICLSVLVSIYGCKNNENSSPSNEVNPSNQNKVQSISLSVIKGYPHDTSSFTQGLTVYKGKMYEGTGGADYDVVGSKFSRLMQVNIETGKAEKSIQLNPKYFGEGITILNDTLYQLTWREHTVFVYTLPDFKKVKEFPLNTEGWGITTNGKELIVSDGSSNLYFYNPSTFQLMHTQAVTQNGDLSFNLNELEYIDGFVYANQWQQPYIFKIDPNSGQIVGRIDVTQIWERIKKIDPVADVPNGIAYDEHTKKIFITGKKWPELYEVQLGQ
ncbi:MAG TPA: glutaminyl-peptide cyclotransferase [Niabella sp.]|nr:glutaminyl-peptide cyclotransferase [Niabella sp.]HQW14849.1 glutaminyl-peptide cyclotransferase [Niabella sp.]HQX18526.1 glutaminyl-peptide cyclotransferase [Niabella sp.]HQX41823.1 glutaminyl-peptide cyclotransferase [Niabella sp.]HRB06053.1 glutaminyl-peptide cyclotransferase [Niabella sp.]